MKEKGKFYPQLENESWLSDLSFAVDITGHLNELNLKLQGKNHFIHNLLGSVKAFEQKLKLWKNQLSQGNVMANHFPELSKRPNINTGKFATELQKLSDDFAKRLQDIRGREKEIKIFANPMNCDIEDAPVNLQAELIEVQNDLALQGTFDPRNALSFYRELPAKDYPNLIRFAKRYASLFGSTYQCEALFSKMKFLKNKQRNALTDEHLNDSLIVANNNHIEVDFHQLLENCSQYQVSH